MANVLQTMRSGATAHPEEIVNFLASRIIETGGVFDKVGGHFLVTEKAAPNMSVDIAVGYAFIPKSDGSMIYPIGSSGGSANVAVTSNASGNPRKDAVVLYIDLSATANSGATNVAKLAVVAGTPAASPSAPTDFAIGSAIGASNPFIRLAEVAVASGASSITNANITDLRAACKISGKFSFKDAIRFMFLDTSAANEFDYSGVTQTLTAGEAFSFGEVGYFKSDSKVWKADADSESTAPALAMALGSIAGNASGLFLLFGTAENAGWSLTVGAPVYLSTTTGAITQTAPNGTDDVVQYLGVATSATSILFRPNVNYVVHT